MRKLNIRLWTRRLTLTAREAPAEMLLALYFFAIYSCPNSCLGDSVLQPWFFHT